jgi:rRNA-processing protein FCF1
MNVVQDEVNELIKKELKAANEKFPLFNSNHEGCAVIKEEVEEAEECIYNVNVALKEVWNNTKSNCVIDYDIEALKSEAINGAIELIQVAAMAQKFIDSNQARNDK